MTVFLPPPELLQSPRGRGFTRRPRTAARVDSLPARADVVLVGGGLAALSLAGALWHAGVGDIVIVDREGRLGGQFLRRADTLGQRTLRSPYDHHPGAEGYRDCELLDFARLQWSSLTAVEKREVRMAQAGHRSVVPLDVFEAYVDHVVDAHDLTERLWQGEVREVVPAGTETVVRTTRGDITASAVVLCTGEERASWPGRLPDRVQYWDEPAARTDTTVVVGAGLSGAHAVANGLTNGSHVHWVLRNGSEHYQCADVNASFFRAEGRARFHNTTWEERLELMRRHRKASVMFEFRPTLEKAEAEGRLTVHRGVEIAGLHAGGVDLADGTAVSGDLAVLALGTQPNVGSELLPPDIVGLRDGWPDLDEATLAYRAAPRVHALGAAACMILGPAARNIDGHRVGVSRVAGSILAQIAAGEKERIHA
ncbi:NAD(P)-binding domain-containing protein [Streptomyces sp. NBC_00464]|uniref:NAD(P)-binding domain-containing protein n=1 Tax=Streptomyces sp. NBC_00464 TaxID=2975751 RepID=UPI002E18A92C